MTTIFPIPLGMVSPRFPFNSISPTLSPFRSMSDKVTLPPFDSCKVNVADSSSGRSLMLTLMGSCRP